jgi:transposase
MLPDWISGRGAQEELLTVETIRKIRLAARDGKKSIRQISRDLCLSRNTVRKVLRSDETRHEYHRTTVHRPKLGPFIEVLSTWLEAEQVLPAKQRRTAERLYAGLQGEGYRGGYDSVRRFVKVWRREHQTTPTDAYIPLSFEPGDAFQFDWSHETVQLGGVTTAVKTAHIRLSHSRFFLAIAYLRESQEMVFDAHNRAFAFFGGACRRGLYDNMKTAVTRILRGKERDFNRRFEQLCSHYLFEPVACTPAAGWEKGQIENQVRTVRRRLFTPQRKAKDLQALNEALMGECLAWAKSRPHPVFKDKTVWVVFEEERPSLLQVARPFDAYAEREVRVSTTALVSFDRNRYSVACTAVGRSVQLRSYAAKIVVMYEGQCIGEHRRCFQRDQMLFEPWHYLPVLERKPGALRNGAPFKHWDLPQALQRTLSALKRFADWDRQFVDILACVPVYGLESVAKACDQALLSGSASRDVVLNLLSRNTQEQAPEVVETPAHLTLDEPPVADCARYDRLRKETIHVAR